MDSVKTLEELIESFESTSAGGTDTYYDPDWLNEWSREKGFHRFYLKDSKGGNESPDLQYLTVSSKRGIYDKSGFPNKELSTEVVEFGDNKYHVAYLDQNPVMIAEHPGPPEYTNPYGHEES